jgi:DNA-binding response OmpR family regulator
MSDQRILVVNASGEMATWLAKLLRLSGDRVDPVTDGEDAFRRVWDSDYDVIVTDLGGPGIDGRDLYMAFQNTWPEVTRRMVFVCDEPSPAMLGFVARTGVPLVRGPVTLLALQAAVRTASGMPRSRALAAS